MSREGSPISPRDRSKEVIDWDLDLKKQVEGKLPDAKYGPVSESLRHSIPETTTCALFCGGRKCKYDNPDHWKPEQMTINGLYSSWVTDNILATSRPNVESMEKYDIIRQFNKAGIKSIINLQTPGEHVSCGPPQHISGFSYDPQEFMDNDVFFYNFGWPDYNVGSLANILDMVKVMQFALSEGKVAVHCHAGLGRTGVLIACYLIFANRMESNETVHYIRSKRPGAIQTRSQLTCIQEFAKYLIPLRVVFSSVDTSAYDFTLGQYLIRQKHMLHGFEARTLKFIPKIVSVICERLLELAKKSHHHTKKRESIDILRETAPGAFNNKYSIKANPSLPSSQSSPSIEHLNDYGQMTAGESSLSLTASTPRPGHSPRIRRGKKQSKSPGPSGSDSDSRSGSSVDLDPRTRMSNGGYPNRGPTDPAGDAVATAMGETSYSEEVKSVVQDYKKKLNEDNSCWRALRKETDPLVLAALMWDWLDHLKEPVLSTQDLPDMLNFADDPAAGLSRLEKGAWHTTDFIIQKIAQLGNLSEKAEVSVIQRALSTLTHQNMVTDFDLTASVEKLSVRRTTNDREMSSNMAMRMMYFFIRLFESGQRRLHKEQESQSNSLH